jgi:hypothetical protein
MFEAFSRAQWRRTVLLLAVCAVLAAAAGVVGTSDNAVGGSLAFLSGIALVLAFAHPWRTSRRFLLLVGVSVAAFVAIVVVGGLIDNAGIDMGVVGNAAFLVAIFLCPAGFLVGIIGAAVAWVTSRRARHVPPAKPVT